MSKYSHFGTVYGDATDDQEGLALHVQEAFNRNGRLISISTYLPSSNASHRRRISSYSIRPNLLPGLIAALQVAQRHTNELKKAELAAMYPTAANDEEA